MVSTLPPLIQSLDHMPISLPGTHDHQALRDAIAALCARFDSAYWRKIDEDRAYPDAFA